MPLESVRITAVLPASADRVYAAWLDGAEHGRMTGAPAKVDPTVGGEHSAWDGYIHGTTLGLEPGRRIVQTWRTSDFPLGSGDSRLEVHLREAGDGCEITLIHTDIPEGQGAQYEEGWRAHYLAPMTRYFSGARRRPARKAAPKKKASPARRKGAPAKKKAAPAKKKAAPAKKKAAPAKKTRPAKKQKAPARKK